MKKNKKKFKKFVGESKIKNEFLKEKRALEYINNKNYKLAESIFRELIFNGSRNEKVYSNLAVLLSLRGEIQETKTLLKKAIQINPKYYEAHTNLGIIYNQERNFDISIELFKKAIIISPNYCNAHFNLGNAYKEINNFKDAIISYKNTIRIDPTHFSSFNNIGLIYHQMKNIESSMYYYKKAILINPDFYITYNNIGLLHREIGDYDIALNYYKKAIKLNNNYAEAYCNQGVTFYRKGNLTKAINSFKKGISLNPKFEELYLNYGILLEELGQFDEAIKIYDLAFEINKNIDIFIMRVIAQRYICDWSTFEKDYCYVKNNENLIKSVQPRNIQFLFDNPSLTLKVSKKYFIDKFLRKEENIKYKEKSKIKIGYFSADFYNHPVTLLISQILKEHNRNIFEIYAYSFGVRLEDKYTEEIKNNVDHFKDLKDLNDIQAVELVRKDGIDIAIDLMGYTEYCRTSIFSMRIAPIQINYLGFSGSMASNCMDYIIADKTLIPKQDRNFYTEKIIYLNQSAICCNDSMRKEGKYFKRSDFNLPENDFLFACFNNNYKITPKEFNIWMRLLKIVKNSRILLKISNKNAKLNLIKEAKLREIDSDRLIFTDHLTLEKHLERHTKIDLFLDTFNYNAGSTAVFSLLSGVPILTKYGRSYQSRMSSSLLEHLGLKELITKDEQEYENKALLLATNPERLKSIKHKLRDALDRKRTLNSKYFVKELEEHLKYLICKIKKINSD